jgi:hypothetical protein
MLTPGNPPVHVSAIRYVDPPLSSIALSLLSLQRPVKLFTAPRTPCRTALVAVGQIRSPVVGPHDAADPQQPLETYPRKDQTAVGFKKSSPTLTAVGVTAAVPESQRDAFNSKFRRMHRSRRKKCCPAAMRAEVPVKAAIATLQQPTAGPDVFA